MAEFGSLIEAAEGGDIEKVREVIANGADLRARTGNGATALHCAAARGHRDVCELLLDNGVDVNDSDYDGRTVLHFAAFGGSNDVVDLLLTRGAFVSAPDDGDRKTPLHLASAQGHVDVVNFLVAGGADVDERDGSGRSALWGAASAGQIEAMEILLALGADVNAADEGGVTPLLAALMDDQTDAARFLLSMGASFAVREQHEGLSPLHVAAARGNRNMVELLLNCGANAEARSASGATPADTAATAGHTEVVEVLRAFAESEAAVLNREVKAQKRDRRGAIGSEQGAEYDPVVVRGSDRFDESAVEDEQTDDIVPGLPDGLFPSTDQTRHADAETAGVLKFALEPDEEEQPGEGRGIPDFSELDQISGEPGDASGVMAEEMEEAEPFMATGISAAPIEPTPPARAEVPPAREEAPQRRAGTTGEERARTRPGLRRQWLSVFFASALGLLALVVALVIPARLNVPQGGGESPEGEAALPDATAGALVTPAAGGRKPARPAPRAPAKASAAQRKTGQTSKLPSAVTATIVTRPPGATVVVDKGMRSGKTPMVVVLRPGEHQVYVTMPGYRPESEVIQVGSAPLKIVLDLKPLLD